VLAKYTQKNLETFEKSKINDNAKNPWSNFWGFLLFTLS